MMKNPKQVVTTLRSAIADPTGKWLRNSRNMNKGRGQDRKRTHGRSLGGDAHPLAEEAVAGEARARSSASRASSFGLRRKTTQRLMEKLRPVATTIPTTAAASLCSLKNAHLPRQEQADRQADHHAGQVARDVGRALLAEATRPGRS